MSREFFDRAHDELDDLDSAGLAHEHSTEDVGGSVDFEILAAQVEEPARAEGPGLT